MAQLGDDSFAAREEASIKLLEAGFAAREALLKGARNSDPEVRDRSRRILAAIEARDHRRRIEAFIKDPDSARPALAGWRRFRTLVGDGKPARQLFVELHEAEGDLLRAMAKEKDKKKVNDMFYDRLAEVQRLLGQRAVLVFGTTQRRQVPLGTAAAFYFIASDTRITLTDTTRLYPLYNLVHQSPLHMELSAGQGKSPLRRLMAGFISRELPGTMGYRGFTMAMQYNLKEVLPAAMKYVTTKTTTSTTRVYAALAVAKFGGKEHAEKLKPLLDEKTTCWTWSRGKNQRYTTQIRDVALAAIIHLSGKNVRDFGFDQAQRTTQYLYSPHTLGFKDDKDREAAIKKWNDWLKTKDKQAKPQG